MTKDNDMWAEDRRCPFCNNEDVSMLMEQIGPTLFSLDLLACNDCGRLHFDSRHADLRFQSPIPITLCGSDEESLQFGALCSKCGSSNFERNFCEAFTCPDYLFMALDHLHVVCSGCGYSWITLTDDVAFLLTHGTGVDNIDGLNNDEASDNGRIDDSPSARIARLKHTSLKHLIEEDDVDD